MLIRLGVFVLLLDEFLFMFLGDISLLIFNYLEQEMKLLRGKVIFLTLAIRTPFTNFILFIFLLLFLLFGLLNLFE